MKNLIINNCMNYIKSNTNYDDIKLKEIKYGIEAIYLMISKLIIIIALSIVLKIHKEVIMFLTIYNILRFKSFGLHATKSWICLVSSTIIFVGIPFLCKNISLHIWVKTIILIIGICLMFKNSPADTKKKPIVSKKKRNQYKTISTLLTIIYSFIAVLTNNQFIANCLIFSIILQNFMTSPTVYKLFKLPYNNYITFLKEHPNFSQ